MISCGLSFTLVLEEGGKVWAFGESLFLALPGATSPSTEVPPNLLFSSSLSASPFSSWCSYLAFSTFLSGCRITNQYNCSVWKRQGPLDEVRDSGFTSSLTFSPFEVHFSPHPPLSQHSTSSCGELHTIVQVDTPSRFLTWGEVVFSSSSLLQKIVEVTVY